MSSDVQFGILFVGLLMASLGFMLFCLKKGKDSTLIEGGIRSAFIRFNFTNSGTIYVLLGFAIILAMVLR